jgi:hypothetical protein
MLFIVNSCWDRSYAWLLVVCEVGSIGVDDVTKSFNGLYENKNIHKRFAPVYNSSASSQEAR